MAGLPKSIIELRRIISKMPGFSERGAERFLEWWWEREPEKEGLLRNWKEFIQLKPCQKCFYFSSENLCEFCGDTERDKSKICVVTSPFAAALIEKGAGYNGLYFVIGGDVVGVRNSKTLESAKRRIVQLSERVEKEKISEVILATDFTSRGEAAALYVEDFLKKYPVKVSRLARGLHTGDSLGYSDPVTLKSAFENRKTESENLN